MSPARPTISAADIALTRRSDQVRSDNFTPYLLTFPPASHCKEAPRDRIKPEHEECDIYFSRLIQFSITKQSAFLAKNCKILSPTKAVSGQLPGIWPANA
jgi:hypothetical protein